ncbi:MAG: sigma-70 family RNA polymerase sigma factor [Ruminococcus sp.]|nr:sigma-70 family RNA polymerase sigma factor [Ruminococcus sp.]
MKDRLLQKLKKHDEEALVSIIDKYSHLVATVAFNISKGSLTKEDIEEIASDVFVLLWKNSDKVQQGKLKGYICSIARTQTLNKIAVVKRKTVLNIDDYDPEDDFSIEDETENMDLQEELRSIIGELGQPDKDILIRHYYYCQTVSQISKNMQINLETVKSKLRRTRDKIKKILIERGYKL